MTIMTEMTPSPTPALDYDSTLIMTVEISDEKWMVAAQVPGLARVTSKRTVMPEADELMAAVEGYQRRAATAGCDVKRVIVAYEAGRSAFWLARWLSRRGVEVHVIQPSSVPVDRRLRRAKSDGIDVELLLRTLLAWLRGGATPRSTVAFGRHLVERPVSLTEHDCLALGAAYNGWQAFTRSLQPLVGQGMAL